MWFNRQQRKISQMVNTQTSQEQSEWNGQIYPQQTHPKIGYSFGTSLYLKKIFKDVKESFLIFSVCSYIPIIFSNYNSYCSNSLNLRNLQEQVRKIFSNFSCTFLYPNIILSSYNSNCSNSLNLRNLQE